MTLLPQELRGTKEGTGSLLPSYYVTPLIIELGKITVGMNYIFIMLAEKSLGRGTNRKTLGKSVLTAKGYPSALGSKALNVVLLFLKKAFGDKHRHIYIFYACFFKATVKVFLDIFPDAVAVGTDNHTALNA
jgi:hypothetical protein